MDRYKTFNIRFLDWNENEHEFYEVARNTAEALDRFYGEFTDIVSRSVRILDMGELTSNNYYIYKDDEGDIFEYHYHNPDTVFYEVSKRYAFSDCCPDFEIEKIVCDGREVRYVGWQPGMTYEYRYNDTNEVAWKNHFEEWDH